MTAHGRDFENYAVSLIRTWEEARARVSVPEEFSHHLTLGAQVTLWPRIGYRWVDALREAMPDLGLRAEMGTSEDLTRAMTEGTMQVMLTHTPRVRPGLSVERLIEDELVLVAPWEGPNPPICPAATPKWNGGQSSCSFRPSICRALACRG